MVRHNYLWLLVFLLLLTPSLAVEVDSLEFYRNGAPVTTISTQNDRLADMLLQFTVTGEFQQITIDLAELVEDEPEKTLAREDCRSSGEGYICEINDLRLQPSSATGQIPVYVNTNEGLETSTLTYEFELDNTQPSVSRIYTEGCEGECYIGPNSKLIIEMQDETATFDQGFIFYSVNGAESRMVKECEGMTCEADVSVDCQQGSSVQVDVVNANIAFPSQDDAGNRVDYNEGDSSAIFTCDRTSPEIVDITYTTSSGDSAILQGETVTVEVLIEDEGQVVGITNFRDFTGEDNQTRIICENQGEYSLCEFNFEVTEEGYTRGSLDFRFRDGGGNSVQGTLDLEILQEEVSDVSNIWNIRGVRFSPRSLNRRTLQYYDKTVTISAEFGSGLGTARIIDQRLSSCYLENSNQGLNYDLVSEGEFAVIDLEVPRNLWDLDDDRLVVNCNISIQSHVGGRLVQEMEDEGFTFNIRLEDYDDVPQLIVNELDHSIESRKEWRKILGTVTKFSNMATSLCKISNILSTTDTAVASGQAAVCTAGNAFPVIKPVTEGIGGVLRGVNEVLGKSTAGLISTGGKFCKFMTCQYDPIGYKDMAWNQIPEQDELEELGFDKDLLFRPEDNLFYSAATLCLPGVANNLKKMEALQCEYERCLGEEVLQYGMPSSSCREAKSVNSCRFWSSQAAGAFPIAQAFETIKGYVLDLITNPFTMFTFIGELTLCSGNAECVSNAVCVIPQAASAASDLKSTINNIESFADATNIGSTPFCEAAINARAPDLTPTLTELRSESGSTATEWDCTIGEGCINDGTRYSPRQGPGILIYSSAEDDTLLAIIDGNYYPADRSIVGHTEDRYTRASITIDTESPYEGEVNEFIGQWTLREQDVVTSESGENLKDDFLEGIDEAEEQYEQLQVEEEESLTEEQKEELDARINLNKIGEVEALIDKGFDTDSPTQYRTWLLRTRQLSQDICSQDACSNYYEALDAAIEACNDNIDQCRQATEDVQAALEQDEEAQRAELPDEPTNWGSMGKYTRALINSVQVGGFFAEVWPSAVDSAWRRSVYSWTEEHLSTQALAESAAKKLNFCTTNFDTDNMGTYSAITGKTTRPSLHIEGYQRTQENYIYAVTAVVMPYPAGTLQFDIELRNEDGSQLLEEDFVINPDSQAYSKTRGDFLQVESGEDFNRVCIVFNNPSQDYRELIGLGAGNAYCNEIVSEDE